MIARFIPLLINTKSVISLSLLAERSIHIVFVLYIYLIRLERRHVPSDADGRETSAVPSTTARDY